MEYKFEEDFRQQPPYPMVGWPDRSGQNLRTYVNKRSKKTEILGTLSMWSRSKM